MMKRFNYEVVINEWGTGGIVAQTKLSSITIHHSAVLSNVSGYSAEQRAKAYTAWARQKGNKGMQYQFFIPYDLSENIYVTNYTSGHVWHNSNYSANQDSLSVLVDGNFQSEKPSAKQLQKLEQLLRDLNDDWFTKNGWFSFETRMKPKDPNAKRTYSEGIVVPSLHWHNEVAQKGHGTACAGANLIPYVAQYRNKRGNVPWGVPKDPPEKTCEEKLAEANGKLERANGEVKVLAEQLKKTIEDCGNEALELNKKIENQSAQIVSLTDSLEKRTEERDQARENVVKLGKELAKCKEGNTGCNPFSFFDR